MAQPLWWTVRLDLAKAHIHLPFNPGIPLVESVAKHEKA